MFHHRWRSEGRRALGFLAGLALLGLLAAPEAHAQSRGFLLGTPKLSMVFKAGFNLPRAGSGNGTQSLWDLTREELTVETADLTGMSIGGELGIRASERLDITLSVGYSIAETRSEFRHWVDTDDLPIEQTTEFATVPVTLGVKAYLRERGRAVGRFAWIPRTWNPYAGVAAGWVNYRFEQWGDFVDYETRDIFNDHFLSTEGGPTVHLVGGMDMQVTSRMMFTGEARYGFAKAPLEADFVGFPDLDLTGFQITGGIGFRF